MEIQKFYYEAMNQITNTILKFMAKLKKRKKSKAQKIILTCMSAGTKRHQ